MGMARRMERMAWAMAGSRAIQPPTSVAEAGVVGGKGRGLVVLQAALLAALVYVALESIVIR